MNALFVPPSFLTLDLMSEPRASVNQIAEHLGVTRDSICRWIDGVHLRAQRVG